MSSTINRESSYLKTVVFAFIGEEVRSAAKNDFMSLEHLVAATDC